MYVNVYCGMCSWLMSVYTRDILSRLPQLLATCTGVCGKILKIDSTKKVHMCREPLLGVPPGVLMSGMSGERCFSVSSWSWKDWKGFVPWPMNEWPDPEVCLNYFEIHSQLF